MADFYQNTHNRHPITCRHGKLWGVNCEFKYPMGSIFAISLVSLNWFIMTSYDELKYNVFVTTFLYIFEQINPVANFAYLCLSESTAGIHLPITRAPGRRHSDYDLGDESQHGGWHTDQVDFRCNGYGSRMHRYLVSNICSSCVGLTNQIQMQMKKKKKRSLHTWIIL